MSPMSDPVDPSRVPRPPAARLSGERDRVIGRLQDAVAADHLDLDELDERLDLAMRARTQAELEVLVADLPALPVVLATSPVQLPAVITTPTATATPASTLPALGEHGSNIKAVFSSSVKRGRRRMPAEMTAKAVFGSVVIDLREATFQPGVTTLRCKSVFGSIEVYAPAHVRVDMDGSGIFGAFEEHGDNSPAELDPEAPVLRVVGKAVFGSVEARVGRRASKKDRPPKGLPLR